MCPSLNPATRNRSQDASHSRRLPSVRRGDKSLFINHLLRNVAGVAGFEPANAGTKNRCLTTWRHPSALLANALLANAVLSVAAGRGAGAARERPIYGKVRSRQAPFWSARRRARAQPMRWTQPCGSAASPRWIDTSAERRLAVTGPDWLPPMVKLPP